MVFGNGVKIIQAVAYNGARKVNEIIEVWKLVVRFYKDFGSIVGGFTQHDMTGFSYFWPVSWLVLLDLASGEHCRGRWIVGQSSLFLWCPSGRTLVPLTGVQALFSENKNK